MPPLPFLDEPLSDGRITVRDIAERDIPETLIAYQDDPEMHLRLGQRRPPSGAQLGQAVEEEPARRASGAGATLTIVEPGSDVCRGGLTVHTIDWDHARAEIGMWVAPQVRGRGLGSAALRLVGRWLIRRCGIERVQITTEPENEAMIRVARAAGFTFEGVLRGYTLEQGHRVDNAMLSLIPSDLDS